MRQAFPALVLLAATLPSGGCAPRTTRLGPTPAPAEPPAPIVPATATGPLAIRIVYPPEARRETLGDTLFIYARDRFQSRDSAFFFGSLGRGDARLLVNGSDVPVYSTGGWIAWTPLPDDTIARFDLIATTDLATQRAALLVLLPPRFRPPGTAVWVDTTSFTPAGARWLRPDEGVRLAVRATPGAAVRAFFPNGGELRFLEDSTREGLPESERAFGIGVMDSTREIPLGRYQAWWVGRFGPDPGPVLLPDTLPVASDSSWVRVEAVLGADTARARWPLRIGWIDPSRPPVAVVHDDTAGTGLTDRSLAGRPSPNGTYHWFFPNGTTAAVSGRANGQVRLQLSRATAAWVDAVDVQPLASGSPPPRGVALSPTLASNPGAVALRIPVGARIPYRVDETERALAVTLYGATADMDWLRYGGPDSLVRLLSFAQRTEDEAVVTVELTQPVWGYRTRWEETDLLLEIRRPPSIDLARPLRGRRIAIDPGHPPTGSTGPTGVREPDVTLAVSLKTADLLRQTGAEVVLLRTSDSAVSLVERVVGAERAQAELMVSIHANALPDGVNPFRSNGTSVFYFHPASAPLARELDRTLVRHLGFPDLGMTRGDLALVRGTWMPSALTEGLFIMLPDQEAVLSSEEGQHRYARGVVEGIEAFLSDWAARVR